MTEQHADTPNLGEKRAALFSVHAPELGSLELAEEASTAPTKAPPTDVEDIGGMTSDDLAVALSEKIKPMKLGGFGTTASDEIAKVAETTIKNRMQDIEKARNAFNDDLRNVSTDILRLIERRQHLRNEITQCERLLDALGLADVSIAIT